MSVRGADGREDPRPSRRAFRTGASVALLGLGVLLSGCFIAVPGSSTPTASQEQDQYFRQAHDLQQAASRCTTAECKDAELTAAVKVYEEILKLNPLSQIAYFDMGVIYTDSGQLSAASTAMEKALLIEPKYFPALYNLAYVSSLSGDTSGAISLYRQAALVSSASKTNRASAYFNLGYLYDTTGKRSLGNAAFVEAVELEPALASKIPAKFVPAGLSTTTTTPAVVGNSGSVSSP